MNGHASVAAGVDTPLPNFTPAKTTAETPTPNPLSDFTPAAETATPNPLSDFTPAKTTADTVAPNPVPDLTPAKTTAETETPSPLLDFTPAAETVVLSPLLDFTPAITTAETVAPSPLPDFTPAAETVVHSPLPDFNPAKTAAETVDSSSTLRQTPKHEHNPESYEDLELEFSPCIFSSLEKHLPLNMLSSNRDEKVKFMSNILLKYLPRGERSRARKHKEYKQNIISNYQRLNKELYTLDPTFFFVPSFLNAVKENTEESFRSVIYEPYPGVYIFKMLQPRFCEMMLSEVENFRMWANETKLRIIRPNTMTQYGAVLDDFGLDSMLEQLIESFIRPISKVFFLDVCGQTLDSHHGFVVEYGEDRDIDLGFHVDDSEVTLNVCLGKEFVGGELYFRGTRCEKHVNTDAQPEETFDYSHIPGQAILHHGRHRHGARATISGHLVNMILWCRSSIFREMRNYQKEFPNWCGECSREKEKKQTQTLAAKRKELIRIEIDENTSQA